MTFFVFSAINFIKSSLISFVNYVNGLGFGQLVDGIGIQAHNYDPAGDPSEAQDLKKAMDRVINEAHIKVRVSELDVSDSSKHSDLFNNFIELKNHTSFFKKRYS